MRDLWRFSPVACALFLSTIFTCWAQSAGDLKIEVKDSSGGAVSAKGMAVSLDSGVKRSFETSAQGTYTLSGLAYGRYQIQVSRAGFSTASFVVDLETASESRSITLSLGTAGYAVDVVSATPLPGVDRTRDEIPLPIQTANDQDIDASGSINLS